VVPIPYFVAVRGIARVLTQRVHCYLLLHQPDKALDQLAFIHDMCRLLQGAPTGKPMTLVAAMSDVAVIGLYANTIGEGLRLHVWQEPQLAAIEQQLKDVKLTPLVVEAMRGEVVFSATAFDRISVVRLARMGVPFSSHPTLTDRMREVPFLLLDSGPKGWLYENVRFVATMETNWFKALDPANNVVTPKELKEFPHIMDAACNHPFPYKLLATIMVPNLTKAAERMAGNQNQANLALVACALERYHVVRGEYPESLDVLIPQFIEKLPNDIINGGILKYRKTSAAFVLYSIGWNEKDDGGVSAHGKDGSPDWDNGDWVWKY
jgi:hypothetical protein